MELCALMNLRMQTKRLIANAIRTVFIDVAFVVDISFLGA